MMKVVRALQMSDPAGMFSRVLDEETLEVWHRVRVVQYPSGFDAGSVSRAVTINPYRSSVTLQQVQGRFRKCRR